MRLQYPRLILLLVWLCILLTARRTFAHTEPPNYQDKAVLVLMDPVLNSNYSESFFLDVSKVLPGVQFIPIFISESRFLVEESTQFKKTAEEIKKAVGYKEVIGSIVIFHGTRNKMYLSSSELPLTASGEELASIYYLLINDLKLSKQQFVILNSCNVSGRCPWGDNFHTSFHKKIKKMLETTKGITSFVSAGFKFPTLQNALSTNSLRENKVDLRLEERLVLKYSNDRNSEILDKFKFFNRFSLSPNITNILSMSVATAFMIGFTDSLFNSTFADIGAGFSMLGLYFGMVFNRFAGAYKVRVLSSSLHLEQEQEGQIGNLLEPILRSNSCSSALSKHH